MDIQSGRYGYGLSYKLPATPSRVPYRNVDMHETKESVS